MVQTFAGAVSVALLATACVHADVAQLLNANQDARDRIVTIRATCAFELFRGSPIDPNKKLTIEVEWIQKADWVKVDHKSFKFDNGKKRTLISERFLSRDRTRTVFQNATPTQRPDNNVVKLQPDNHKIPPYPLWRYALFTMWTVDVSDERTPQLVTYAEALKLRKQLRISRVDESGANQVTLLFENGASETVTFDRVSGLVVSRVVRPQEDARQEMKVLSFQNVKGTQFPERVEFKTIFSKAGKNERVSELLTGRIWVHSINDDIPDSDFALPEVLPRAEFNYADNSAAIYDEKGNVTSTGAIRPMEEVVRDLNALPPEGWKWPWITGIGVVSILATLTIWRFMRG